MFSLFLVIFLFSLLFCLSLGDEIKFIINVSLCKYTYTTESGTNSMIDLRPIDDVRLRESSKNAIWVPSLNGDGKALAKK